MGYCDDGDGFAWLDASANDTGDDQLRWLEAERQLIERDNRALHETLRKFSDPKAAMLIAHENNAMKRDLAKLAATFVAISATEVRLRPAKSGGVVESFHIAIETLPGETLLQWYDYGVIAKLAAGLRSLHPEVAATIPQLPLPLVGGAKDSARRLVQVHQFFRAVSTMPGLKWKIRAPDSGTYSSVPCTTACLESTYLGGSSRNAPPPASPTVKKHNRFKWWRRGTV
ncbi:hypothetical protein ACHHYP_16899 [Achlya hypogyna]|uniref:PX domain-containing protein n=1 Tax=Achlya hypogyna TaxID=1202772 RepID=A0A1V9ZDU7_ACHHY|nr:hypothetical protein ACHHYP_16899 [Achlya hypogyna]